MFTVGNVDRDIDRYIGRHSIDMAVDSRSIVDRQSLDYRSTIDRLSIDCRSTVDREMVDSRSIVGRQSVDRAINHRPSIGRYFVDTPRPNIGHMSVVYRSTVGDMSVSCRWHIGQLSVAYRSTVGRISVNCRSHISRVLI